MGVAAAVVSRDPPDAPQAMSGDGGGGDVTLAGPAAAAVSAAAAASATAASAWSLRVRSAAWALLHDPLGVDRAVAAGLRLRALGGSPAAVRWVDQALACSVDGTTTDGGEGSKAAPMMPWWSPWMEREKKMMS
jgi:hypothetical protein